jgi:AraC-like DNA-binding protein
MAKTKQEMDWRLRVFVEAGVDLELLERRVPGAIDRVNHHAATIPQDETASLLEEAGKLARTSHLGLRLAQLSDFRDMGVFGFMVLSATNVRQMFQLAVHYHPLLYRRSSYIFTIDEAGAVFEFKPQFAGKISYRQDCEWTLASYVHLVRRVTASNWQPGKVTFTHSAPEDLPALREVFGSAILFDQPGNSFSLEPSLLETPIGKQDAKLSSLLREEAEQMLAAIKKADSLADHVRLMILKNLGRGDASSDTIARELGMSRSKLKRNLNMINHSFRALRDGVIYDVASQSLAETSSSITSIALMLGYSELSAFDRAFFRLTGMSPGEYRRVNGRSVSAK